MGTLEQQNKQQAADNLTTYQEDLALISSIAHQAGQIGLQYFGQDPKVWTKEGGSPVSEADYAVDHFIKEKLLEARPHYGWLSEETADDRSPATYQRTFVVDPIDGTRGFLHHNPQWCVSIAVVENGKTIAAVLECPALQEHFLATADGMASLNGRDIHIAPLAGQSSNAQQKAIPFEARISCRAKDLQNFLPDLEEKVHQVEHIPSLAYRLALLALGKLDMVLVRPGCNDWDIAAIDLILKNCGGALVSQHGQPVIYCRKPFTHSFLIGLKRDNLAATLKEVSVS